MSFPAMYKKIMEKMPFDPVAMDVIVFAAADVITTSNTGSGGNKNEIELPVDWW